MRQKKVRALRKAAEVNRPYMKDKCFYPQGTMHGIYFSFEKNASNPIKNFEREFRRLNRKLTIEELK